MAKAKQRVKSGYRPNRQAVNKEASAGDSSGSEQSTGIPVAPAWVGWSRRGALALLGGIIVYAAYFPSDSVLVESGDALWFCALSLGMLTLTLAGEPMIRLGRTGDSGNDRKIGELLGGGLIIDLLVWNLAAWVVVAAFLTCPPGNLRAATNEAWLWIAGAAVITSARRLLVDHATRATTITLILAASAGLTGHALHQELISLPKLRAEFVADPDKVMRDIGMYAPRLSSERMIFAGRLMDGGPTATFALANSLAAALMATVVIPAGLLCRWRSDHRNLWVNGFLAFSRSIGIGGHHRDAQSQCDPRLPCRHRADAGSSVAFWHRC